MKHAPKFEIFLSAPPGLELILKAEALERGFRKSKAVPGGVIFRGNWHDVWRANLELRGAGRVLARIGSFKATHLKQLEREARSFGWGRTLRKGMPVQVDVTCKTSKIYHQGAVKERFEQALVEGMGAQISADNTQRIMVRIESDICTVSVDTSGTLLHKRGHKEAIGKAPMRETMAALFLRACGYTGHEPVLDPMCGSGTFVLEAAEMALGLPPGRSRRFAFEDLVSFDPGIWAEMKHMSLQQGSDLRFFGSDRDTGAIRAATANTGRAGIEDICQFRCHAVSDVARPDGPPGLVIVNPPYGARIGDNRQLFALYAALGRVMTDRFQGWRVGMITTDAGLAKATGLPFSDPGPVVAHGGLKVRLWQTDALPA